MRGKALTAAVFAVVAFVALVALAGCGSTSSGADAEETPAVKRPSANPPDFHQTEYDVNTTWTQEASDKRGDGYLESVWHDPGLPEYKMVIDSQASEGTAPPLASAKLARRQVNGLTGYRELGLKKVKIGDRPVIRWTYALDGTHHFAYFFAECGVSIAMRGSGPGGAAAFAFFYETVVSRIKPVCDE